MNKILNIIEKEIIRLGNFSLTIEVIIEIIITILITYMILWVIKKTLLRKRIKNTHNHGSMYSLYQIIKYVVWITTLLFILDLLGIRLNALLAGSAALLVGIGLGLQNTFNDFVSGIILLFEGSIKVEDILEIDHEVVKIKKIGLRTSAAVNRDDIIIIIPNSLITTSKVINWSHQLKMSRFKIAVGVAYGSNVDLVLEILRQSASEHNDVTKKDKITSRFTDFGNSSLDFELLFFSKNIFRIENVKSEIRVIINNKFKENNITIPFPQVDLHFKSDDTGYFSGNAAK